MRRVWHVAGIRDEHLRSSHLDGRWKPLIFTKSACHSCRPAREQRIYVSWQGRQLRHYGPCVLSCLAVQFYLHHSRKQGCYWLWHPVTRDMMSSKTYNNRPWRNVDFDNVDVVLMPSILKEVSQTRTKIVFKWSRHPQDDQYQKQQAWLDSTHRKTNTLTTKFSVRHFALFSYSKSTREEIWRCVGLESEREVVESLLRDFVAGIKVQACARDFLFWGGPGMSICMRSWGACREWRVRARPKMDNVPISQYPCITWSF
jgi:hypothetical protein